MDKIIRDGDVAVCYSPGYGAGWSTWANDDQKERMIFHPNIVEWIEGGKKRDIEDILARIFGSNSPYSGGAVNLMIKWVPMGQRFYIAEYDGYESVVSDDSRVMTA
jgi:hypothetical protein